MSGRLLISADLPLSNIEVTLLRLDKRIHLPIGVEYGLLLTAIGLERPLVLAMAHELRCVATPLAHVHLLLAVLVPVLNEPHSLDVFELLGFFLSA